VLFILCDRTRIEKSRRSEILGAESLILLQLLSGGPITKNRSFIEYCR